MPISGTWRCASNIAGSWCATEVDGLPAITPDAHGIAVLLLTAAALYLFTRDNLPAPGFEKDDSTTAVSLVWKR